MTLPLAFALTAAVFFIAAVLIVIVDDEIAALLAALSFLLSVVFALVAIWTGYAA